MKLPANCRYARTAPECRSAIGKIEEGEIVCCRAGMHYLLGGDELPLCRAEGDEVYRITYKHAFGAHAWVRLSRRGEEADVHRVYHPETYSYPECFDAKLTLTDWRRFQDVLISANFWSLPPVVRPRGRWLDGYHITVEGRRGDVFRATRLDHPDTQELWQIGRVAFDLAGLGAVRL